jgi:DNA-binding beta-propeller fold protein YncE
MSLVQQLLAACACAVLAGSAWAQGPYAMVTGRRDPRVIVIDLAKAMDPANAGTQNAVISRIRITPDVPSIDPARSDAKTVGIKMVPGQALANNIIIPPGGKAYVVDHAGLSRPEEVNSGMPHGYPGAVTVLDVKKALDPANNDTTKAIDAIYPSGSGGPAGIVITPDGRHIIVTNSEGLGHEDGGSEIGVINLATHALERVAFLARGTGGQVAQSPGHSCAEMALNPALIPHDSPNPNWGCFADPNGMSFSPRGGGTLFTANEGTNDVSVLNLPRLLAGAPDFEIFRIPVERGPWGVATSPDGSLVVVTDRDSDETDKGGRFISLIDVDKAIARAPDAEIRRVLVGTDDPKGESRPFGATFTPDGTKILVANFDAANLSVVDVKKALAGAVQPEIARIPLPLPAGSGTKAQPRGVAVTPDGRYAVVCGGQANNPGGGSVWVVDLARGKIVGTVTGVGNEPYLLAITQ